MSNYESHLTLPQYQYDLVVATTQRAINATIKKYLSNFEGQQFISCYLDDGVIKPANYDELTAIAGMDIFSIPSTGKQNPEQQAAAQRLYDETEFTFGFKASMGLPEGFPIEDLPSVIVLNKGSGMVTYNLFFKDISIINMRYKKKGFEWVNVAQEYIDESSVPWVFQFFVSLDMNDDNTGSVFNSLPTEVKLKAKNLNPNSAFSVQQLYLDLNTAGLTESPVIVGIDPEAASYLDTVFIKSYYKLLQKESISDTNPNGNYLLGYAIKPVDPNTASSSIIPTNLNILISPYWELGDAASKNYDLYTLNYLVMTDNHKMAPAYPLVWNWIEDTQQTEYHGVMSIKKDIFSDFLNTTLSPALSTICIEPKCSIDVKVLPIPKVNWNFETFPYFGPPLSYTKVDDNTTRVLTFHYEASDHDERWGAIWGNITVTVTIDSDIYLQQNLIKCVTTATVNLHINIEGGVTAGDFVKYRTETLYEIGIGQDGNLTAKMAPDSPIFTDLSDPIRAEGWSKFVTLGRITEKINNMKNYWSVMKNFLTNHGLAIAVMLNGSCAWVFPGGNTFIFKDVAFSNFQDLTAHIIYVEPE